jgi:predicted N-formylglutamate amidohydrolase
MRAGAAPSTQCDVQRQRVTRPLVTCEHGGNRIPSRYAALFVGRQRLLASHRGHDPGALAMARSLSRAIGAPLVAATISRLLVELNRSPGREFRFSPIMRTAPAALRAEVCRRYYLPYWSAVESFVDQARANGERVVHVSSHSFTPSLDGSMLRNADIGLLYDPARECELELCTRWQAALRARLPHWAVRRNYPYRGRSDGLTRYLRLHFDAATYCGIEIEVNQKHVRNGSAIPPRERAAVGAALREALASLTSGSVTSGSDPEVTVRRSGFP